MKININEGDRLRLGDSALKVPSAKGTFGRVRKAERAGTGHPIFSSSPLWPGVRPDARTKNVSQGRYEWRQNVVSSRIRSFQKILLGILFSCVIGIQAVWALEIPKRPEGYVSDYAKMISPAVRERLEEKLHRFEQETSNQVIVVTFLSLEGEAPEDFSMRLAEAWKVGQKGKDNGVILLVFKSDRAVRIETGYGLEGALTDAISKSIIENEIVPRFRQGNFDEGIEEAVDAILRATQGEYQAENHPSYPARDYMGPALFAAFFFGMTLPVILLWFLFVLGIFLIGFGIFVGPLLFCLPLGFLIGISPLLLYFLFGRHRRLPMILGPRSYRGNDFFGGSGGFGGGGFSGGGGSFGGGGASGRW